MTPHFIARLFIFVLTLTTISGLSAQETNIKGRVIARSSGDPLEGASVRVVRVRDSVVTGGFAKVDGKFNISLLNPGAYRVFVSFVGYQSYDTLVRVRGVEDLGLIALRTDTVRIRDIVVEGDRQRLEIRGDTTSYHADAYKVNPEATSEDLIRKLPGITIDGGQVRAKGEEVRRVLVDGKEFFGSDVNASLRNTPAEMIDRVEVFDRQTDASMFSGFDDGQGERTLNLVTKQNMRNGQFGRIYAGAGSDERFSTGITINHFSANQRLTVLGAGNNINEQNFSFADIMGTMGGGGRSSRWNAFGPTGSPPIRSMHGSSSMSDFFVNQQNGITTTYAGGLNYTDVLAPNLSVSASYFVNRSDNRNETDLFRTFVMGDTQGQVYQENDSSAGANINHRLNLRVDWYIDTLNAVTFSPRITSQFFDANTSISGGTLATGNLPLNTTASGTERVSDAASLSGTLLWRHRLAENGRNFTVSVTANADKQDVVENLEAENRLFTIDSISTLDQRATTDNASRTTSGSITYTEPMRSKDMLQLSYSPSFSTDRNDRQTFTKPDLEDGFTDLVSALSNVLSSNWTTHSAGALYRWRMEEHIITFGGNFQYAGLTGEQRVPAEFNVEKTFQNFLPTFMWNWRPASTTNLRLFYRTRTSPPSVTQLQTAINNSNPLALSTGNPDLAQDYTHTIMLRFSNSSETGGTSFFAFVMGSLTQDYIGQTTTIASTDQWLNDNVLLPRGGQLTRPVNLDGMLSLRSFFHLGLPAEFLGSTLNSGGGVTHSRTPSQINGNENLSSSSALTTRIGLSTTQWTSVDLSVAYNATYNIVDNSLQKSLNSNFFSHTAWFRGIVRIGQFTCSTEVTNTYFTGLGTEYDRNFTVLNAGLGWRFMSDQFELRASVFDLLGQNDAISRVINETVIDDSRSLVLTRYGLLTLTYNLRNLSSAKVSG